MHIYTCSWDQKGCEQSVPQYPLHWRCGRESKTTSCSGTRSALSLTCECTCTCIVYMYSIKMNWCIYIVYVYNLYAESLAYLTAATHGLAEEAQNIADTLQPTVEKVRSWRAEGAHLVVQLAQFSIYIYVSDDAFWPWDCPCARCKCNWPCLFRSPSCINA